MQELGAGGGEGWPGGPSEVETFLVLGRGERVGVGFGMDNRGGGPDGVRAPAVEDAGVPFFVGRGVAEGGFGCLASGPLGDGG
jgi:hypothetical protein